MPQAVVPLRFAFLQKLEHLTQEAFSAHWRGQHARLAAGVPHFWRRNRRYVQNHVLASWPGDAQPAWNGIVEMHERVGAEALHHLREDPEFLARVAPDEQLFLRQDRLMRLGVTTRTLVAGGATGQKFLVLVRKKPEADAQAFETWLAGERVQAARAALAPAAVQRWDLHVAVPGTGMAWFDHAGYDAIEAVWLEARGRETEALLRALQVSLQGGPVAAAQVHAVEEVEIPQP